MAKLLSTPRLTSIRLRTVTSTLSKSSSSPIHSSPTVFPISLHSNPLFFSLYTTPLLTLRSVDNPSNNHRNFSVSAFDTKNDDISSSSKDETKDVPIAEINDDDTAKSSTKDDQYPTGEFEFEEYGAWKSLVVKFRMLFAFPWERVRKGSVLTMKLRGQISDQLQSRFSSGLSLPQICENLMKAAYDPRISGVYLHIEPLGCGWGKVEEIRRHILDFRKSGKFIVGYAPACGEKEYYIGCACQELYAPPSAYFALYGLTVQASFLGGVFEKVGIEPQVQRIGKYKSAGDQLMRKSISDENREMLTALLDNIYGNWLEKVAITKGKKKEDIEQFVNDGVYQIERLKEESWITDIKYDDEVMSMLKERLGILKDKKLPEVDYRKYSKVRRWTLGLTGYKDQIAIIRASGSISRTRGPFSSPSSGIIAEKLIEKIRSVRESKRFKAVVLRIDSPGGDALASDLMWREIRLLAESKPVIASMADVAASGGYYMAMAAQAIVAENLTLTGSIGVVTGKFNLGNLYEKIGFNKETISRGRYAELTAAEQRPFRPEEAELFAKSAQHAYTQFRDKAALSRSMTVDKMEEVAQGRVWTGKDALSRGLVDAVGGLSLAVAIAKQKANIPQDRQVSVVELSRPSASLPEVLSGIGSSLAGADRTLKELLNDVASSDGIQARMDGVMFEKLGGAAYTNPLFMLIKDCLSSF
ncbi:serine protease SPPA, chloroplastic isoform X1 [Solanum stenotomum]|uniref:serine protease SPPA, chloroplastic isoform X1 n=2 Tax=Solanum stenotomum TaxID=172797 RepID=UPI0020D09741|nr:serine protease SPPA, chloroplastic isoform X1 [Solanum stenotomum]XP_049396400.1 serine protease SPPA, chloroplastic isoform X1 [Solanum stenotomum]XP_049396401.1 serine protease SPPA, chloroplastic isoform X1 [Solanum stenotomum]XP_049396402.1 serine protease SPPA, chloroplastic isoform X1 [Solanum stenotomum]